MSRGAAPAPKSPLGSSASPQESDFFFIHLNSGNHTPCRPCDVPGVVAAFVCITWQWSAWRVAPELAPTGVRDGAACSRCCFSPGVDGAG